MARRRIPLRGAVQLIQRIQQGRGGDIWFALDETRPLVCFAGIWINWTSVRKVKEGETTNDVYAFLTTEPNAEVGAIHPKAMPVILTTPQEVETWMTAPLTRPGSCSGHCRTARSGSSPAASKKIRLRQPRPPSYAPVSIEILLSPAIWCAKRR